VSALLASDLFHDDSREWAMGRIVDVFSDIHILDWDLDVVRLALLLS